MPRRSQTGHTGHKFALSHLFSDHPKQSYAGHAKRAQKANLCQQQRDCPEQVDAHPQAEDGATSDFSVLLS